MVENIRKYLREEVEDLETNQQEIGVRHVFRSFSINSRNGTDFSENKHTAYNIIVNKHCMDYYCKFWKDVNETLYDKDVQRKRIIEWQKIDK